MKNLSKVWQLEMQKISLQTNPCHMGSHSKLLKVIQIVQAFLDLPEGPG